MIAFLIIHLALIFYHGVFFDMHYTSYVDTLFCFAGHRGFVNKAPKKISPRGDICCMNNNSFLIRNYSEKAVDEEKVKILYSSLKKNPHFIAGFTTGEGSFTASLQFSEKAMWGFWPQCEFNLSQHERDVNLLFAINRFFENKGSVYNRECSISSLSFRRIDLLVKTIIPFFEQHPVLGNKNIEFLRWKELVYFVHRKAHVGRGLDKRDSLCFFIAESKELNKSITRPNPRKHARLLIIKDWLQSLNDIPTLSQKQSVNSEIKKALKDL
uniref:hypothetical protein n=1 Tax=Gormaniella terricola TaxID=2904618 RepID=UPI0021CC5A9F|nr:hypothetical protein ODF01_mgp11 [Gormaniella terricola]UWV18317.1 hypothetical protein [Gormaniella terricola]